MTKIEIWKDIPSYEGLYKISNLGRLKSLKKGEEILSPPTYNTGYIVAKLFKNGIYKRIGVHRIVAMSFIDNPLNKKMVNHIDGNKLNNCLSNLEWATSQENHTHAQLKGLKAKGESHGMSKLTKENVKIINSLLMDGVPQRQIAVKFNVCQATIKDINLKRTWN